MDEFRRNSRKSDRKSSLRRFSSESTERLYSSSGSVASLSAETTPIMAHTENSGEGEVPSNSQSTYTTPNSLIAGDIIESNKAIFSALTEVLQKTLTSMGNHLREHSKCQMEQVNKSTEAVNPMTFLHNANKLAARRTGDPENPDNSDSGEHDEVNDGWNWVTIHETDRSFYNETDLATSFLSHQETSSSSVATTGKPEDDPMMGSIFKEFSESCQ